MAESDFDELLNAYERAVDACLENAKQSLDLSRDSWSKLKDDNYKASTFVKDSADMYARSINVYRKMMSNWMRVEEQADDVNAGDANQSEGEG